MNLKFDQVGQFWSEDERALVNLIQTFLSSNSVPVLNVQHPISLPTNNPHQFYHLLNRLINLIQSLTERLHIFTLDQLELSSNLKISQSNLILAESTIHSLEDLIHKLRHPPAPSHKRRDRAETEHDLSLYGRLNLFRFTRKSVLPSTKITSPPLSVISLMNPSIPPSSSPSPSLTCSTTFSTSSLGSSASSSSSAASSLSPREVEKLKEELAQLRSQNDNLRADLESVSQAKKDIESELETMSIELFEEANRMVRAEKIKSVSLENELIELRNRISSTQIVKQTILEEVPIPFSASPEPDSILRLIHQNFDNDWAHVSDDQDHLLVEGKDKLSTRVSTPVLRTRQPTEEADHSQVETKFKSTSISCSRASSLPGLKPLFLSTNSPLNSPNPSNSQHSLTNNLVNQSNHSHRRLASLGQQCKSPKSYRNSVSYNNRVRSPLSQVYHELSNHGRRASSCQSSFDLSNHHHHHIHPLIEESKSSIKRISSNSSLSKIQNESSITDEINHHKRSSIIYHNSIKNKSLIKTNSPIELNSSDGIELDLDQLLASIIDCAESLGMEDELEGII
ncbi:hypothetical protein CROQUDRAFT_671364 [Cronartium quercuum f. sp. fusiforme G11]|uniref:GDP/GTP exchange factor Sec2 N-terminal domain-containing protein n=1 Tax=Cronartium quercuum f. sp. fusiforme G11 TaxID=708437 RepID=A0A9P6NM60_9BASI|nr:hypothetical protein CROQUDRAFT_671364 [Cronartium quercuum f. sp. fusiforme G11]